MSGVRGVVAVLTTVVVAGCASMGSPARNFAYADAAMVAAGPQVGARRVLVQNNSWDRITVYMRSEAGALVRLGDVESMNREVFPLSDVADDGANIQFIARPLAGQSFSSEQFLFPVGTTATWTIENHTALSSVKIR